MLDREPLSYPSRERFVYDPGIPDRQLWAIGMVVVQWSMTEWFIDMSTRNLIGDDAAVLSQLKSVRNFQHAVAFWKGQIESRVQEPVRTTMLALVPRVQALSAQRDEVVHRLWGGGIEETSPSAAGSKSSDAGMLPNPGEKVKQRTEGPIPFAWKADFARLRRLATDIASLNRDLLQISFLPGAPHGHVDVGG